MIRPLVSADDPVLRQKAMPSPYDWHLVRDLFDTLRANNGVGLAAPQIGVSKQVAVIEIDGLPLVIGNPLVFWYSDETDIATEWCLSLPNVARLVRRYSSLVLDALDERGPYRIGLSGLAARVVQHELDHFDGLLITDRAAFAFEQG